MARQPDPNRPGTVYRSKPKLFQRKDSGGRRPAPPGAASPPPGVGDVYGQHGGGYAPGEGQYYDGYDDGRGGYQPPPGYGPGYGPGHDPYDATPTRRRGWRPRRIVLLVVLLLIAYPLLLGITAWTSLNRVDAIGPAHDVADPGNQPGTTYLVVGSDSREGLTKAQRKKLGTGSVGGKRTDTIMLLHTGGGATVLVSIPRDSYVPIPGHGSNKINAAYAFGGPSLLIRTIEQVTGVRIDEYVETGLGGFANVVDAVGGVTLCPKFRMNDKDAHINLKKGCQEMDGRTALGYARARHSDPRGDLGRVERQRETLAAISKKALAPATLAQPWRAFPAAKAGGNALTVDEGTGPIGVTKFVLAMRAVSGGGGLSLTVPVSNPNFRTPSGASAVQWDRAKALRLFAALKTNDPDAVKPLAEEQRKDSEAFS